MLYRMACGEMPDPSEERAEMLTRIEDDEQQRLIDFVLHTNQADRPTASELVDEIEMLSPL